MEKKKNYLEIEEIISAPIITDISLSPNGKKIAYIKEIANWKDNTYDNQLYIYDLEEDKHLRVSKEGSSDSSPKWAPDSSRLAFIRGIQEKSKTVSQIFILDGCDTPVQSTDFSESVTHFNWSPDGSGFYFLANHPEDDYIKERKEMYGEFSIFRNENTFNSLYYNDISKSMSILSSNYNTPKDMLTDDKYTPDELVKGGEFYIRSFTVSPDGNKIALYCSGVPHLEILTDGSIKLYDIGSKEIKEIVMEHSACNGMHFSPDSKRLCFRKTLLEQSHYMRNIDDSELAIYNIESDHISTPVSECDSHMSPTAWTDKGLLVLWQRGTSYEMYLIDESYKITPVFPDEDSFIYSCSATCDGSHIAYVKANPEETFEVFIDDRKVTDFSSLLRGRPNSVKEKVSWKSADGLDIEGILVKPENFDPSKKYPLLVNVHGGPTWSSFRIPSIWDRQYPIDSFISKGFLMLEPNYRGSTGYGDEFMKSNFRKLGTGDYLDIISGVDHLISLGMVDGDNVGIMGWSQGGYISAFCSAYSDRFKAISVGAGISSWNTYYNSTDITQFTWMYLGDTPWNDPEIYAETSPMTYIKSACTPTLIQHGDSDLRVPVSNAYELYRGLKDQNVEAELVLFKGMEHFSNNPKQSRAIMKQNLLWFSHHMLGEELNDLRRMK